MKILPTYTKKEISAEELERTSELFLQEMFEDELRRKWSRRLEQDHDLVRTNIAKRRLLTRWSVGIAATLLLALGVWQLLTPPAPQKQELLALYLQDHFTNTEIRKGETTVDELRSKAILAYNEGAFEQAAISRQQLIDQDPSPTKDDYFYLGLSYLYQHPPRASEAIQWLSLAQTVSPKRKYELEGKWSLALAYLLQGEDEKAQPLLEELAAANWKAEEAARLLLLLKIDE